MAQDDWRIRIELPDEDGARGFLDRLGVTKGDAEEFAEELREHRLAVSRDGGTVFVYAPTGMQSGRGSRLVERELQDEGLTPARFVTERWLREEERWDEYTDTGDVEEDMIR